MGLMKPFKPLTLLRRTDAPQELHHADPPAKRRKVSHEPHQPADLGPDGEGTDSSVTTAANIRHHSRGPGGFVAPQRKPLDAVANSSSPSQHSTQSDCGVEGYYNVLWRKFSTKKNKTWDGDGILSVSGGYAILRDLSGKELGKTSCKVPLLVGSGLTISGKEVEVEAMISKQEFISGRAFLGGPKQKPAANLEAVSQTSRPPAKHLKTHQRPVALASETLPRANQNPPSTVSAFRAPLLHNTVQAPGRDSRTAVARHDPHAPDALVMKRPLHVPQGKQIVDVVVDPLIARKLREHQRVGVSFLYECVMGMKGYDGEGAILADEMGVGKTLQTIALLWTLLKQNPIYEDAPVVKKALIVCPVTLINNWRKEFNKWLGKERVGVFVAGNKNTRLTDFTRGKAYSVMIIGYEKLRTVQADLQKGAGIDIVIADEGHRLKTAQNKSAMAIKSLNTERRIILSGTPLQNDLAEFYTMVDFVNPGLLNKYSTFRRDFELPILKGQQPGASEKDVEKGESRSEELTSVTKMFILRRTADILSKYLPPKTEYVVFCRPTKAQLKIYRCIVDSPLFSAALGSPSLSLELITILKKVCNSHTLLKSTSDKGEDMTKDELVRCIPPKLLNSPPSSGKLQVLDSLLHTIRTTSDEKVVLISNYTSTMDVLASLVSSLDYKYLRLDGSTPANKRQDLVDRFNRGPASDSFVFLLSAKAGGIGLNLIGASRLILFDLDWNPATDLQAMARVHRDGQRRPCYIYRLVTQGVLDEKIFQRQISKTGLADSIVDGKAGVSGFTRDELRDIFSIDAAPDCQTHRLLGCGCGGLATPLAPPEDECETEVARNDLSLLDGQQRPTSDADDEEPEMTLTQRSDFVTAKEYDREADERRARECRDAAGKSKMLSLMQYTHFDTALISQGAKERGQDSMAEDDDAEGSLDTALLEAAVEDAALRSVLRQDDKRIGFVFTKLSV